MGNVDKTQASELVPAVPQHLTVGVVGLEVPAFHQIGLRRANDVEVKEGPIALLALLNRARDALVIREMLDEERHDSHHRAHYHEERQSEPPGGRSSERGGGRKSGR